MPNPYFQFKQFTIQQDRCAMKVTTDACLFGAWISEEAKNEKLAAKNILDIGTGTSVLDLTLAQKLPVAQIDTIEVDEEACQQAKENIAASPFVSKINVLHADVREFSFDTGYDVIISNPPFYEKEIISADQKKNVAHHASTLTIEELLKIIKTCLKDDGIFYLLLPFKRNEEIKKKISQQNLLVSKLVFVKQSLQHNYFRIMIKGKLNWGDDRETSVGEISICNDGQQYSEDFKILLKDYYLHL